jgi:myo-inositol-1-phosphate synthase
MQLKINFLCKDSILAAPLVIEIARLLEYAQRCGMSGVQSQLSVFFKMPQMSNEAAERPEHALHAQEAMLVDWLTKYAAQPTRGNGRSKKAKAASE